jgi:hypothetical protein
LRFWRGRGSGPGSEKLLQFPGFLFSHNTIELIGLLILNFVFSAELLGTFSVMEVHFQHLNRVPFGVLATIEELLTSARIRGRDATRVGGVEEGVHVDHVARHLVCPFEYLGAKIHKKSVRGPASEDHNLMDRVIH